LWDSEFWSDGYYVGTVSGGRDKCVIENYLKSQGREKDVKQVMLFET